MEHVETAEKAQRESAGDLGSYQVSANFGALARVALGTSCTIATLLCIPDAVAIIPTSTSVGVWLVRVSGLWLSALIQWMIGFALLTYAASMLAGSIKLDAEGVKLWRFGKKIRWDSIRALGLETQPFFSAAFCQNPPVLRLSVYVEQRGKKGVGKKGKKGLKAQHIPSFQFARADFLSLFGFISKRAFGFVPQSPYALISGESERSDLRRTYERGRMQRVLISLFIACSLVAFLGRRAAVYYIYNEGNREFRAERYREAKERYAVATAIDPVFAKAWDQLARSEFRLGETDTAREHWKRALVLRPDMVEAKLGLATLCVRESEFEQARELLAKCLRLQPRYQPVYLNLADLDLRTGNPSKAVQSLSYLLDEDKTNMRANALMARALVRLGQLERAKKVVAEAPRRDGPLADRLLLDLVAAEVDIAHGDYQQAEEALARLSGSSPNSYELLLAAARVKTALGKSEEAIRCIRAAQQLRPAEMWPHLLRAELARANGDNAGFQASLHHILVSGMKDPGALVHAATLALAANRLEDAEKFVSRTLTLDPTNESANALLKSHAELFQCVDGAQARVDRVRQRGDGLHQKGDGTHQTGGELRQRGDGLHQKGDGTHQTGGELRQRGDGLHQKGDGTHQTGGELRQRGDGLHQKGDGTHQTGGELRQRGDEPDQHGSVRQSGDERKGALEPNHGRGESADGHR